MIESTRLWVRISETILIILAMMSRYQKAAAEINQQLVKFAPLLRVWWKYIQITIDKNSFAPPFAPSGLRMSDYARHNAIFRANHQATYCVFSLIFASLGLFNNQNPVEIPLKNQAGTTSRFLLFLHAESSPFFYFPLTAPQPPVVELAGANKICSTTSETDVNFTQKSLPKDWTLYPNGVMMWLSK